MIDEAITDSYPLSPMQQGMVFHSLSGREPGVDIEQIICALHEPLDVGAFERAWQRVVERHAILRTSFHWDGVAEPRQEVHSHVPVNVHSLDWRDLSPSKRQELFEACLLTDRLRGVDLAKAPLLRLALFRIGETDYQLVWTFHHLLLDGRAVTQLLREVFELTEAFSRGADVQLPPPVPFRDYINWLQQQDLTKAEAFWRQTLAGFNAPTPLVVSRSSINEAEEGQVRGEQEVVLSSMVTTKLKSIAKENNLTLNTLIQGAWALLLSRYSGEEDVLFGAVRACRRSSVEGAESIIGLLINTVPVRVQVPSDGLLLPWLATLRNTWRALRDYEHTPLVNIQHWSGVRRGQPLFESIFNFQDPSWDAALRAQGGKWANREFGICSQSNYPLVVDAYGADPVKVKLLYHRKRFADATISRMLGHFKTLLEGMATNPNERISNLPLLTEAERNQLLSQWNDTLADFPRDKCVHQLFEEQAARTPRALAVADEKKELTYLELNDQADQLAQHLRACGVGPDTCVGVCLERSVEMVVALLAVWKAGGAYVPLDPTYPQDRLAFMLEDAKMPVMLTQTSLRENLKFQIASLKVFCVDALLEASRNSQHESRTRTKDQGTGATRSPQPSTSLAYVIYTSGTTGTPKGVEIEHRSLINLIAWHQRSYGVTPADRATQLATPAFDASVWELWPYLTAGASIHIADEETRLSPKMLRDWLTDKKITLTFIPTPIAEATLDEPWPENCALRAVLTGGDKLHRAPGESFPCALINHYGPTENTVVTTWVSVLPRTNKGGAPPIGRPVANTQVYVLDRQLQPVPIGVPGELHISGVGLARGYHNRHELTAEKFIPNPFSHEAKARLYKTGDLVRWLPDGNLEFIGRMDNQVKVRGWRIELGEIETVLGRHPDVQDAVVVAHEHAPGENRLAAYIVPAVRREPSGDALREFLKQKLPDQMVPSTYTLLDSLPLTPNGKVDRAALPVPKLDSNAKFVAPRTATEEKLAGIWCEVLGCRRAGVHDNFFELGGHSLLATQVISRIRSELQTELSVRDLFDSPTIACLVKKIAPTVRTLPKISSPEIATNSNGSGNTPLSFAQERLWFLEQLEPGLAFNNIPIAFRLKGTFNFAALEEAFNEIIHRHETLRTIFKKEDGHPVAVGTTAQPFSLRTVDLSTLPESDREARAWRLVSEEARHPFDLSQCPLLHAKLIRLTANEFLFQIVTHHIACDGWSLGVLYRELSALYDAFAQGNPSPLPELRFRYADFAQWQRGWLQGELLQEQLNWWKQQLKDAPTALDVPTDYPRPPEQTYRGATQCFKLPAKLSNNLAQLSRKEDVTLFMLLLAAWQTLLHRYTGQDDMLVGSPIAGRNRVETENLIGFFLNTLVLRGDLSGDPTFRELLARVRHTALDAYAHQDVPFEKLVDALQPERDLSRSPLFQVMFVLQNEPLRPLELDGLKLTPLYVHSGTAKFDMMLSMEETTAGLSGFIEYNTDLFDETAIVRMLGQFQTLLESVAANPAQRLSMLPLLPETERKQLLVEWNDTSVKFVPDKCIHQLFEEQVGRTPDAVAVVFADVQFTYRELNERANQVAEELRALGVGPDVRVGICVKRSLEMMMGLLGILKAGGCYVPLDPTYPKERLTFMLQDAQVPVLLTQDKLQAEFKFEIPNLKLLCLDAPRFSSTATHHDFLPHPTPRASQSGDLAYVIYTSGSTGQPKGVMITHRNVVNFFAGMDQLLGTAPGVWLAVTSISFDISVLELFWTLARGFKVVIQLDEERKNGQGRSVSDEIIRHCVSHMQCTPSLARAILLAPESHQAIRRLGKLLLGGEALPVSLAHQLGALLPSGLINMYGPTETTVWSTAYPVSECTSSVPIGRPIANTQIYILDKNFQPAPIGVPGEILIGGDGVTRGYLNRPELTAERFIRNPFNTDASAHLYRTGDLGRWLADGNIEFLGRLDHQVKIRGHRIELGEIETALGCHPSVREAVVVVLEDSPDDQRLVAYVVANPESKPPTTELRQFLLASLPEAMTPSVFVFLDALPLTPNGKVNRKGLPAPESHRPELETAYVAPRSDLEKSLAAIWRELLHVEQVGLHDNFFDLGGHSLLVVQAQARLRDILGRDVPVVKLFQYPTVSALAGFLSENRQTPAHKVHNRGHRKQTALHRHPKREHEVMA